MCRILKITSVMPKKEQSSTLKAWVWKKRRWIVTSGTPELWSSSIYSFLEYGPSTALRRRHDAVPQVVCVGHQTSRLTVSLQILCQTVFWQACFLVASLTILEEKLTKTACLICPFLLGNLIDMLKDKVFSVEKNPIFYVFVFVRTGIKRKARRVVRCNLRTRVQHYWSRCAKFILFP